MIAHQGGWDEILLVLGPILLIVGLLRLAKARVTRQPPATDPTPPGHSASGEHMSNDTVTNNSGPHDTGPRDIGP